MMITTTPQTTTKTSVPMRQTRSCLFASTGRNVEDYMNGELYNDDSLEWLDDRDQAICEGDNCRIIDYDHQELNSRERVILDEVLKWMPLILPLVAYNLYDPTAQLFAAIIDSLTPGNWVAVDGGAYKAQIIAPAINGVVVAAISILFAVLIGTTISTLKQRQADIQLAVHIEATQLRILQSLLEFYPNTTTALAQKCRYYLHEYTSRLLAEGNGMVNLEALDLSGMDSELNAVLAQLNSAAAGASIRNSINTSTNIPPLLLSQSFTACHRLYEERAKRITALQSTFPLLHYALLAALANSICVAFLMETNQDILVFLNSIQLRLLWTILVGTFSALGLVCYDLGHPFRGSYQISKSVDQLYTIRLGFEIAMEQEEEQLDEMSSDGVVTS
jgi:hypothetical protein